MMSMTSMTSMTSRTRSRTRTRIRSSRSKRSSRRRVGGDPKGGAVGTVDGGDGDGVLRHQQIVESILGFSIPILGAVMPQGVDRP